MGSNREYWAVRFEELEREQINATEEFLKYQINIYNKSFNSVIEKIEGWFNRLAVNNGVSMTEAKKLLTNNELEAFKWTLEDYINKGSTNAQGVYNKLLEDASSKYHINRLEALKTSIKSELDILYTTLNENLTDHLKTQYTDKVYKTAFEIAKGTGVGTNILQLNSSAVNSAIKNAWCSDGKNFSTRIWKDNNRLYTALNSVVRTSVIQGKSYKETARDITKQLNVSKSNAMRLVRTESAYISSVAELETLKALDVEYYQISITLDERTSETCQEMSEKIFNHY